MPVRAEGDPLEQERHRGPSGVGSPAAVGGQNGLHVAPELLVDDGLAWAPLRLMAQHAQSGDIPAAKLILERTLPALKSAAETLTLPGADTPASQGRTVLGACAQGDITLDEAAILMQALAAQGRLVEVEDLAQRLTALEEVMQRTTRQ
jgi:hypothetical protein